MKSWKLSELKFISNNLHLSDKELADHFSVSESSVDGTRQRHKIFRPTDGRFKKGKKTWNTGISFNAGGRSIQTRFKKGGTPPNAFRNVGDVFTIIDRNGKPYQFIKLEYHRQYPYGRYLWEQHFGQKMSKGDLIRYKDGNPANCTIENIEKISRKENVLRNTNRRKAGQSLKETWGVVRAFEDYGLKPPYKLKSKRKTA
jgi:hypothetical protein